MYNFYDLSMLEQLDLTDINDKHSIFSTVGLQLIDKNQYIYNNYYLYNNIYNIIIYNKEKINKKEFSGFDITRPQIQDLMCAVWANDHFAIDNIVYHTASLEMYNIANLFFGSDSIVFHKKRFLWA